MTPADKNIFQTEENVDARHIHNKLIWANQRTVEDHCLQGKTWSGNVTGCWLILEGGVRLINSKREIHAKEGEWLFISSLHAQQHFQKNTRIISIRFLLEYLGGKPLFQRTDHQLFESHRYPELKKAARNLVSTFQPWQKKDELLLSVRETPLQQHFQIQAAFNLWLSSYIDVMLKQGESIQRFSRFDPRVEKALYYIEHQPLSLKFKEEALAEHVGLSVNQLLLLFRKETGTSPFSFYNQRRLKAAQNCLAETTIPIKELAFDLGFGSPSHFSTWFKQIEKCSPRAYRKAMPGMTHCVHPSPRQKD